MGQTHIRTPKNFVLEERLERYADAIEVAPETYRGSWAAACAPVRAASAATADDPAASPAPAAGTFDAVYLDLGCGKGAYLTACAARDPRSLYLGMDTEPICIAYAAQRIVEGELKNALVLPRSAESLERIFAPGEVAGITLNFPTPFPKRKYAGKRLVNVDHLLAYRALLAPASRCAPTANRCAITRSPSSKPPDTRCIGCPMTCARNIRDTPRRNTRRASRHKAPPYTASAQHPPPRRPQHKSKPVAMPSKALPNTFLAT
ncbi:hypothetical protein [uncultured Enorma sp.]|uniref:tRNA (guanine(46)-N(7))-methyltransferase TrmB n=1 Tax=uncultured Enorma sp. TaxID=1714346 RepID=UPI0034573E78